MSDKTQFPPGWDEERARRVIEHCEHQSEEEAVAEDEAAYEDRERMKVERVGQDRLRVYMNLAQAYEAEFSAITKKTPTADGTFELDTPVDDAHRAYIAWVDGVPAGIANIGVAGEGRFEVCEFYVVPVFRGVRCGTEFIHSIWSATPGRWEIKQIAGAGYATRFWRRAIVAYDDTEFEESEYDDPYWGRVTRQTLEIQAGRSIHDREGKRSASQGRER